MTDVWHMRPTALHDDAALQTYVIAMFENGYRPGFMDQLLTSNPSLPVRIYSLHRFGFWRVLLILTPWMLANLLTPDTNPGLFVPDQPIGQPIGRDAAGHLLGPLIRFTVLDRQYKAHLNFDSHLGHYLLQPLILCMERYPDAEAVLTAWNRRLAGHSNCKTPSPPYRGCSREVSRREILTRLGEKIY